MLHARMAASTLSRRDNFFIQQATVHEKVALALDAVSIVVGIVLIVLAIVALARAGGHRLPFVVLLLGMLCYLISHTLYVAARLLAYDESTFEDGALAFLSITVAGPAFAVFTDIAALLAAILVLWNRESSLAFAHPSEKPRVVKRLLDGGLIALLTILNVAKQAFLRDTLQKVAKRLISQDTYLKRTQTYLDMRHAYSVFYFTAVVDVIVTAALLRSKVSRVGAKGDKPVSTILFVLSPLLLVHWFWYLFEGSWNAARANQFTETSYYIVTDVSVAENMVFPAGIAITLIVLGIRRTIWNTFGDQPLAGRPTFYPQQQQQQQYSYPQQQQPMYGQPAAMQQPAPGQSAPPAGQQAQWQPAQQ